MKVHIYARIAEDEFTVKTVTEVLESALISSALTARAQKNFSSLEALENALAIQCETLHSRIVCEISCISDSAINNGVLLTWEDTRTLAIEGECMSFAVAPTLEAAKLLWVALTKEV